MTEDELKYYEKNQIYSVEDIIEQLKNIPDSEVTNPEYYFFLDHASWEWQAHILKVWGTANIDSLLKNPNIWRGNLRDDLLVIATSDPYTESKRIILDPLG